MIDIIFRGGDVSQGALWALQHVSSDKTRPALQHCRVAGAAGESSVVLESTDSFSAALVTVPTAAPLTADVNVVVPGEFLRVAAKTPVKNEGVARVGDGGVSWVVGSSSSSWRDASDDFTFPDIRGLVPAGDVAPLAHPVGLSVGMLAKLGRMKGAAPFRFRFRGPEGTAIVDVDSEKGGVSALLLVMPCRIPENYGLHSNVLRGVSESGGR